MVGTNKQPRVYICMHMCYYELEQVWLFKYRFSQIFVTTDRGDKKKQTNNLR